MPPIAAAAALEAGAGEAGAAGAGAAGAEAGAGGGLPGMLKDFNDIPGAQILGSIGGKVVHAAMGAIGTGKNPVERVDEGPVGQMA